MTRVILWILLNAEMLNKNKYRRQFPMTFFSQGVYFNPSCLPLSSSFCHRREGGNRVPLPLWRIATWTKCTHTVFINLIHILSPDTTAVALGYVLFIVQNDTNCNFGKRIHLLASTPLCVSHILLTFPFLIDNLEKQSISLPTCVFQFLGCQSQVSLKH